MRISSFRVEGFQSFSSSGTVELTKGINLIVGQNNSGKSSLLRSLQNLTDDRHKNETTYEDHLLKEPMLFVSAVISGEELRDSFIRRTGIFFVPMPRVYSQRNEEFSGEIIGAAELHVSFERPAGGPFTRGPVPSLIGNSFSLGDDWITLIIFVEGNQLRFGEQSSQDDTLHDACWEIWTRKFFHFNAERMNIGRSPSQHQRRLLPSAENLPAVLATLHYERPGVFSRLVGHLRDILPTVGGLSVGPALGVPNILEVRVWPTENQERPELGFPLSASGTGVSQILAILTAVMTVDDATIAIDEINSFLHPAAVKALLRILKTDYMQHQFIISTHSPDVIAASGATSLHMVRRGGFESTVAPLNISKIDELRDLMNHLGVSLSDVFAAERILWVEGPTEELCFPRLYEFATGQPKPRGTVISALAATGDLSRKRDQELVSEIYQKVSEAALVVAAAIALDRELLDKDARDEMARKARGRLFFLPRRHIECYLLDPDAIAAFLNSRDMYEGKIIDGPTVAEELLRLAEDTRFKIAEWNGDLTDEVWLSEVDAAKLIGAACVQLTESRVTFNKKKDSEALLLYMLEHVPERLTALAEFIRDTVDALQKM